MWTSPHIPRGRFTPKGEPSPPPPKVGRTIFIVGAAVFAGLSGFYLNMLRNKRKQERDGTNPTYEQVIAHVKTRPLALNNNNAASESRKSAAPNRTEGHDLN